VIFDLPFDDEISFLALMVVLKDYNSLGMSLQSCFATLILDHFLMVAARGLASQFSSSTMVIRTLGSPGTSTRLVGCYSLAFW
jgi:hypothetical protein